MLGIGALIPRIGLLIPRITALMLGITAVIPATTTMILGIIVLIPGIDALIPDGLSRFHNPLSAIRRGGCLVSTSAALAVLARDVCLLGAMLTNVVLMAGYLASVAILAMALDRWPFALTRFAFVRVGREISLPVPAAVMALLETIPDEKTTYREPPARKLALSSFPGELRVERDQVVVRFSPGRNCIVARPPLFGFGGSRLLVRVDASAVQGSLLLRGRYLPGEEVLFLVLAGCWLAGTAAHGIRAFWLVVIVALMVVSAFRQHRTARTCFDSAVDEMKRRIAAADPNAPREAPAARETASLRTQREDDERLPWTCACGKVNEPGRKTCRRCWSPRHQPS